MAAASSILSMGEGYVLPSSNSSKPYQYLVDTIGLDHNYSRSWSEREKTPYARPAKELFTRQPHSGSELSKNPPSGAKISKDEIIDVVTVEGGTSKGPGAISMQYDVAKSKVVMSECEKFVSSASNKKTPDTWEELICRTGWTTQQNVLFDKILKIVSAYRLAWLTYQGSPNEPVLRRVAVDKATKRVRQIFSRIEWDIKLTTWLHGSMVDGLSIPLLACYLDIIQTLRSKVPSLVDKMVVGSTAQRRVSTSTTDNMTALLKRPWEATVGLTSFQRPRKITGTPLLLIVPGGPTTNATGNSTKRSRFWHHHLSSFGKVIPVTMHLSNSGRSVSIGQCLDHMIGAVQAKVLELKNHFPNRPVILIGWSTGALVSFQVALKEKVCAVVCLGFPLFGVEGLRGGANDPFLDCKTPTMFVIGSLSTACSLRDIEEFRKKLLADTSLLVIGGADYQLRLTSAKKNMEGVTQSVVDRRIMDDIGEFLNHAVSSMNDDSHPRLNYFELDDIESRRKKPKTESRKRPQTDANKKPRARFSKPGSTQESGTKKPKTVKNSKKAPAMKPVVLVPTSNQPSASTAATHLPGNIPIAPIRSANSAIPGGILQGVTVPLTGVNGPISGVSVALSGVTVPVSHVSIPGVRIPSVNVPVSAVNVPVSAVIKQGSLGGRSFVFSCSPSTNPNPGSTNAVVATPGIATISSSGTTQHLKIVMHPSADGTVKVTNPPKTAMSPELPSSLQYKTAILTASLPAKPGASNRTLTTDGSTCRSSAALSSNNAPQCSAVTETSAVSSRAVISESPVSSPIIVTSPAVKSLSTPTTTARAVTSSNVLSLVGRPVSCTSSTKPSTSPSVVTVPKSPIPGGQAQYFVHRAQLAAISKQGTVSVSPGNPSVTSPPRPLLSTAGPRVKTPTNTKPQTVGSSLPSKQTTVRVSQSGLAQTTCGNVVRKTPSSQSVTPTIQVGVKRTVTYNPSTTTKTVTVVSRPLPSAALTTLAPNATAINLARLKEKLKTISSLSTLSIGSNVGTVLLKPTQLLNEQPESTPAQDLSQGNAEQTSTSAPTGSTAQITSEISTQSSFHSVAQAVSSIKSPSLSKSSLPSTSFPTTAPADASSIVQVLLSSVETSVSQSSRTTNTRMAEKSNVLPSGGQSLPSAAPISVKSTAQSSLSSTVETSAKSSVLLSGPSNTLSNKPTSIETSVQAGKVSCGESSGQSGSQSCSEASSESVSQRSEPASSPKSNTQPGGQLTSPKTVKEDTPTTVETKPRIVQTTSGSVSISSEQSKTKPLPSTSGATKAATSAATTLEHESTGSETARNENEHKLAEKVSDVAKGVVGGSQRTTRQSVRRLEAAAKLAGAEQKRGENENDLKEKS